MIRCSKCDAENEDYRLRCGNCGRVMSKRGDYVEPKQQDVIIGSIETMRRQLAEEKREAAEAGAKLEESSEGLGWLDDEKVVSGPVSESSPATRRVSVREMQKISGLVDLSQYADVIEGDGGPTGEETVPIDRPPGLERPPEEKPPSGRFRTPTGRVRGDASKKGHTASRPRPQVDDAPSGRYRTQPPGRQPPPPPPERGESRRIHRPRRTTTRRTPPPRPERNRGDTQSGRRPPPRPRRVEPEVRCYLLTDRVGDAPISLKTTLRYLVGRDPGCDICLRDTTLSRKHCRLSVDDKGQCEMQDLGSRNGTYVNDCAVQKCLLRDGDVLQLGAHLLTFREGPPPPDEEETRLLRAIPGALTGLISANGVPSVLRLLLEGKRSGILTLRSGREQASLFISEGQVVHALAGELFGEEALRFVLPAQEGSFHFMDEPVPLEPTIVADTRELLDSL